MSKKITKQSEVKPATTKKERPTKVVKTVDAKPADDEAKYLEELKRDAEEERAEQEAFKAKELAAIRQLGAAIKENVEKKVEPVSVPVVEKKVEEEVKEPVVELATSHPDSCGFFGSYDPNNKDCTRECNEICPDCANACKALMESKLVKGKAPKKARPAKESATKSKVGPVSKFSCSYLTMQNGKIDTSLETAKTLEKHATDTETSIARVKSHIAWLVAQKSGTCKKVIVGDTIHFELI